VRSDAENAGVGGTNCSGGALGADVIINVTDSCALERSLFFTTQLIGAGTPVVVALNMADLAEKNGISVDTQRLSRMLGAPAVSVSAARRTGLSELLDTAIAEAEKARGDGDRNRSIAGKNQKPPVPQGATEEMRYAFISSVISACVTGCAPATGSLRRAVASDRADAVLTHTVAGPLIFLAIMAVIFYITFSAGNAIAGLIGRVLGALSVYIGGVLSDAGAADWAISLVIDGIIAGVGGVLMFLPNILLLFLLLALLEDSGYMARAAYLADGVMVRLGLTDKAFIPIILGLGCSVPAIMATRILEGRQQRLRAILMIPFVACGSRLPVFILISALFFGRYAWLVTFGAFCAGILAAVIVAFIGSRLDDEKDRPGPMIIELPDYKLPSARTVFISVYEKLREYL
ncbi:MAG TPA: ferrous iron transporter B, partial [Bacillota bacterium]|nr:ferrous iron transporter B [Bacillota bacterium]